jgi:calcineurin-like phosphoesterase
LDEVLKQIESDYILVDVHAEATSEKLAIAHYLDGRVTAVVGTHTHVPTADNIILPKGTMYITDIGMTGSLYGILGADRTLIMNKFLTGLPGRIEEHKTGPLQLNAVLIDTDLNKIKRINIFE